MYKSKETIDGTIESGLADGIDPTDAVPTAKHIHDVLHPNDKPSKIKVSSGADAAKSAQREVTNETREADHNPNAYRANKAYEMKKLKSVNMGKGRYYKRIRSLPMVEREEESENEYRVHTTKPVKMLTTRYSFALWRRKPHGVYYRDGMFYRIENVRTWMVGDEPREWEHCFVPIKDETIQDMYIQQTMEQGKCPTVSIHVVNGMAVSIVGGTTPLDTTEYHPEDMDVSFLEALLDLEFNPTKKEDRKKAADKKRLNARYRKMHQTKKAE